MFLDVNRLETGIEKMQQMFNKDIEEIKNNIYIYKQKSCQIAITS